MKKIQYFIFLTSLLILVSCSPSKKDAMKFNDDIVKDQKNILALENKVITEIYDWAPYEQVKESLKKFTDSTKSLLDKYENMKKFDKTDEFRLAMIELCKTMKDNAENRYPKIINYLAIPLETEIADSDYEEMDKLLKEIDDIANPANTKFVEAQKSFASRYNFQLEKNTTE